MLDNLLLLAESLEDCGASSKALKVKDDDHAAHLYYKILLALRLILMKTLRLLFLQAFLTCFLSTFSKGVVSRRHLGFESQN